MIEYTAKKLGEDFYSIEEGGVRSFLVLGADKAMLVDTGMDGEGIREFAASLTDLPLMLVTTHADRDHTGGHRLFDETWMHPSEFELFREKSDSLIELLPLWGGDVIDLGSSKWEVILVPGHTPGSIALLDESGRLIVGDSVQNGAVFMFGRGRNLDAFIASMEKLSKRAWEFTELYPSHDTIPVPPTKIADMLNGAKLLKEGMGTPKEVDMPMPMPCREYDFGFAKFLY